jgi:hypothetical protein
MRALPALLVPLVIATAIAIPRPASACVYASEADQLVGWSADGAYALYALSTASGLSHAEIHPTRSEGYLYWIEPEGESIVVKRLPFSRCMPFMEGEVVETVRGTLDLRTLLGLETITNLGIGAIDNARWIDSAAFVVTFTPSRRYADHRLAVRDPSKRFDADLVVPVWCVGSCIRDEDWKRWAAEITGVTRVGDRTLYRVRMKRVCNGGHGKSMWMERIIAAPDPRAKRPKRRTCKGSG